MALPCLHIEPVLWVAEPSACCVSLVLLGHKILGLGKGFLKDFESFFEIFCCYDCWKNLVKHRAVLPVLVYFPSRKENVEVGGKANRRREGRDMQERNIKTRNTEEVKMEVRLPEI